ncbi:MAG: hypothetical protein KDI79_08385 [Anaerolineae bacterium]|nr:hypothetical protein [Anaerolineae bacterium]
MSKFKILIPILFSFVMAAGYGLFVRLAFGSEQLSTVFGTLSVGFLFVAPVVIGVLTQYFAPAQYRTNWLYAFFAPWAPCFIFSALAVALSWEAWICVVMALPVFFTMSTVGGLLMCWFLTAFDASTKSQTTLAVVLLVLPFMIAPIEGQLPRQDTLRTVHTQIEVEAEPAAVWQQITRVAEITEAEHHFSFFHLAGLPRPQSATLTYDGVGGVRHGQWENGLAFVERISQWQPNESYVMQMEADTRAVTGTSLPLQEIGGRYFDVVAGKYAIEPVGDKGVILHFTSTYRLNTRFNFYSSLWTDFFMRDVQMYILEIMKARAEALL